MISNQRWEHSDAFDLAMPNVAAIKRCMARGMKAAQAMDYVMGEGAFKEFASKIWHNIRNEDDSK